MQHAPTLLLLKENARQIIPANPGIAPLVQHAKEETAPARQKILLARDTAKTEHAMAVEQIVI